MNPEFDFRPSDVRKRTPGSFKLQCSGNNRARTHSCQVSPQVHLAWASNLQRVCSLEASVMSNIFRNLVASDPILFEQHPTLGVVVCATCKMFLGS
jgi:hypothetical protein